MDNDHQELKQILREQNQLLKANNDLLHKIHRYEMVSFWSKILWIVVLVGIPLLIYYFFLEPYATSILQFIQNANDTFHQVPGWDRFMDLYKLENGTSTTHQ